MGASDDKDNSAGKLGEAKVGTNVIPGQKMVAVREKKAKTV